MIKEDYINNLNYFEQENELSQNVEKNYMNYYQTSVDLIKNFDQKSV